MKLELQRPSLTLLPSYLSFLDEMRALGEKVWEGLALNPDEQPAAFIERILAEESKPLPGQVAATTLCGAW